MAGFPRAAPCVAALAAFALVGAAGAECGEWGACSVGGTPITQRNLTSKYYWPRARGNPVDYMRTTFTLPRDLKSAFRWSWHHPDGRHRTIVRGNPVIDDSRNIYIVTEMGLFKLTPTGDQVWSYRVPSGAMMQVSPCIWDGAIIGSSADSTVYSVDLETGRENWARNFGTRTGGDTHYVEAIDGIALAGLDDPGEGGNRRIIALNTSTGDKVWDYNVSKTLWNFSPVFVGDGTFITMDVTGGTYRFALSDGRLIWHAAVDAYPDSFTDGGVMIGPDGTSYTCSNNVGDEEGALRAYQLRDGALLWERLLPTGCTSWPAISADGAWGALAAGHFVNTPAAQHFTQRLPWLPMWALIAIHWLSLVSGGLELYLPWLAGGPKVRPVRTYVIAFDTATGKSIWEYRVPDYNRISGKGDDFGLAGRLKAIGEGRGHSPWCLPTSWGTPTIAGDGTIHVPHSSGTLYAVKDRNGDGAIDPGSEVSTFDILDAPLPNNPAWAPGMMAVATCDSLFVFAAEER